MKKDFDRWNELKKSIDIRCDGNKRYFNEREIWWCSVGINIGTEANGKNEL